MDFGGVDGVEYINHKSSYFEPNKPYMHELIKYFEDRGYKRGKNIRAAPYDFRSSGLKDATNF